MPNEKRVLKLLQKLKLQEIQLLAWKSAYERNLSVMQRGTHTITNTTIKSRQCKTFYVPTQEEVLFIYF